MIKGWLSSLVLSIQYFSRIPVPITVRFDEKTIKRSIFFFPLVGWIIGSLVYGFYQLADNFFPTPLLSVLLVSFMYWLTGALHADGWMDVFDGIGSSRDKERMLEIMKDSRVGAMGVAGFVILFAIKVTSLMVLLDSPFIQEVLIFSLLFARWGVLLAVYSFSYARKEGLSKSFKKWLTLPYLLLSVIWLLPVFWLSSHFLLILLTTLLFVVASGYFFTRKFDGLTGDIYGFLIEGGEALLWLVFVVLS